MALDRDRYPLLAELASRVGKVRGSLSIRATDNKFEQGQPYVVAADDAFDDNVAGDNAEGRPAPHTSQQARVHLDKNSEKPATLGRALLAALPCPAPDAEVDIADLAGKMISDTAFLDACGVKAASKKFKHIIEQLLLHGGEAPREAAWLLLRYAGHKRSQSHGNHGVVMCTGGVPRETYMPAASHAATPVLVFARGEDGGWSCAETPAGCLGACLLASMAASSELAAAVDDDRAKDLARAVAFADDPFAASVPGKGIRLTKTSRAALAERLARLRAETKN
jgi:hypothetical protein